MPKHGNERAHSVSVIPCVPSTRFACSEHQGTRLWGAEDGLLSAVLGLGLAAARCLLHATGGLFRVRLGCVLITRVISKGLPVDVMHASSPRAAMMQMDGGDPAKTPLLPTPPTAMGHLDAHSHSLATLVDEQALGGPLVSQKVEDKKDGLVVGSAPSTPSPDSQGPSAPSSPATPMAAYISAAHGSPAEGSSGRGGRRRGSKNINEEDTAQLLSLCLRFVPVSCRGWEEVTEEFNKWAESYGRPTRPRTSIKNKFDRLCTMNPTSGRSVTFSEQAKRIEALIQQKQASRDRELLVEPGVAGRAGASMHDSDDGALDLQPTNGVLDDDEDGSEPGSLKRKRVHKPGGESAPKRRRTNDELSPAMHLEQRLVDMKEQEERYQEFQRCMLQTQMEFQEKMMRMMDDIMARVGGVLGSGAAGGARVGDAVGPRTGGIEPLSVMEGMHGRGGGADGRGAGERVTDDRGDAATTSVRPEAQENGDGTMGQRGDHVSHRV